MSPWTLLGWICLLLAFAGIVLPLLPTTPFVLLAAGCFARSSPRLHQWLLQHRLFGPMLHDWEEKRCIPCRVRRLAIIMMLAVGGTSVTLIVEGIWLKLTGLLLIATGCIVVMRIRVCEALGTPPAPTQKELP